jgi:hypothetical protein
MNFPIFNILGEPLEKNIFTTLKKYFNDHKDQKVLVLHGYEVMNLDSLERNDKNGKKMKDVQKEEKDFIIVNLTFGYILAIEAKATLNSKSIEKARKQLEGTKKMLKKWFGADLMQPWKFFSAVYCERGDEFNKLCRNCNLDFVFSGPDELLVMLENMHNGYPGLKKVTQLARTKILSLDKNIFD